MDSVTDPGPYVRALRASHDRLSGIAAALDPAGLRKQSYDTEWSIAQVLSHLGSGAEIALLNVDAGLSGGELPAQQDFQAIWDVWNARPPEEQAAESVVANEALVSRLESLGTEQLGAFRVTMFGMNLDSAALFGMRLSEHAVHTWDVAVALDPAARMSPDAVELLIDRLPQLTGWVGKKAADPALIAVATTAPARAYTLDTGGVTLTQGAPGPGGPASGSLELTAEALLRLAYGRLDESVIAPGEVRASNVSLADLRAVFPGF